MTQSFAHVRSGVAGAAGTAVIDGGVPETIEAAFRPEPSRTAAEKYTRDLTSSHYENFSVVSFLLPRHLRQDFCNVYAFCRIADDLGDEIGDKAKSLELLSRFKADTLDCYQGQFRSVVFQALAGTIERHGIPPEPFLHLIDAFEQDQRVSRYDTFEQVVDYCTRSADPVGRLVLYMCGYRDEQRQRLSDKTCTALQLANFWQDVRRDMIERDRIYLPRESMARFGVTEAQLRDGRCDENFRRLIKFEVDRTQAMFDEGAKLLPLLAPRYRKQIALFGGGGQAILGAIRRQNYDTLTRRPRLSKGQKMGLMMRALVAYLSPFGRGAA
jgi:squalene synthase HpnC